METSSKRSKKALLEWIKGVAVDATNEPEDMLRWKKRVLNDRRRLFARLDNDTKEEEFPPKKKQKELLKKVALVDSPSHPRRTSERIAQGARWNIPNLKTPEKRVGVGPTFQADVPDWTGPPTEKDKADYKEDMDTLRWLGTQVWPAERGDKKTSEEAIGKGRPDSCDCPSTGSLTCISSHVSAARHQLKADLGQAFADWGFDSMGEEVSKSLSDEEQRGSAH